MKRDFAWSLAHLHLIVIVRRMSVELPLYRSFSCFLCVVAVLMTVLSVHVESVLAKSVSAEAPEAQAAFIEAGLARTEDRPAISEAKPVISETKPAISEIKPVVREGKPVISKNKIATDPMVEECTRIGKKLGSVTVKHCLAIHLSDTGERSVRGQAILIKEYPPLLEQRKPIARVLLIGGMHGDEYASVSVVFKWMQTLDKYHSGLFHWHVSPLINPDGLLLSSPSARLNARGVDLNRNMPTPDWYKSTGVYWHQTGNDPRRNPGVEPLSEPESRWLYEEIRTFKPDAIISVHAPYGLLDYDGPPVAPGKMGSLRLKRLGAFPGSLGNFAGKQHDIPVITVELASAGSMPAAQDISKMWMDLVHWLRYNIPKDVTMKGYGAFDETTQMLLASPRLNEKEKAEIAVMPVISGQHDSMLEIKGSVGEE
ncbi:MAG: M14 family murein peptide amidase A [Mariprofundus sp.]|nr:M14 family murein peptide amidase A [Mariprofundus sp.]